MPWYAMGLSILATQASAITFISTTGQGYIDGMRFDDSWDEETLLETIRQTIRDQQKYPAAKESGKGRTKQTPRKTHYKK